jgi:uncharacterized protein YegL
MNNTHITFILDRSGSMESVRDSTIAGFNRFVAEQQQLDGFATITLVLFNARITAAFSQTPLKDVKPLNHETYVPTGATALLDAIGSSVARAEAHLNSRPEHERPRPIVVILTDGFENSSREHTREGIFEMVKTRREHGWSFIFLGANQDAIEEGGGLGIGADSSITFSHDGPGTASAFSSASCLVQTSRQEPNPESNPP